jgi:mRNA interferase MazF
MQRGEVRMVDFEPARGAEANKRRPAIIVSNDEANSTAAQIGRGVLTVVPVTSNVDRVYPFQVLLPSGAGGLPHDSKAQAEQVRSIDAERVGALLGSLPDRLMASLDEALRLHLAL